MFAMIAPTLFTAHAQPHKSAGLVRKEALEANDPRPAARALKYVAASLSVAAPEAYVRPDQKESIAYLSCIDKQTPVPVFLLGQPLLVDKRPERELVFELTRRVALLRPERQLRLVLPQPAQISHLIDAAMAVADSTEKGGAQPSSEIAKTVQGLRKALSPVQLEQVAAVGRRLRAAGTRAEAAALAWLQATDLTASRAALVLGNDLETCARLLASEPPSQTALPATQRLLDLIWSSVTEELFAARKHLGLM
jgi:hypothetical protein